MEEQVTLGSSSVAKAGKQLKTESVGKLAKTDTSKRLKTGVDEVDSVLGGGFVAGSVTLIAGQPGIGKSTLLLQIADKLTRSNRVLYIN